MSVKSAIAKALENFDPSNPFHVAPKKYGEYNYMRVIECATDFQRETVESGGTVTEISEAVRRKAMEIFAGERLMRGMRLEEELGL